MIHIIIPVHNRYKYTYDCIKSLEAQTVQDFKIIVVDDGSTDETADLLELNFPEITILKGDGNLWWTGSINLGVKHLLNLSPSGNDYVLTINNDLIVEPDYLEHLLSIAKDNAKSVVGSISVDIHNNATVHHAGVSWNPYTAKYSEIVEKEVFIKELQQKTNVLESTLLSGRGVLFPIKLFKDIGLYDESNFPHYTADYDFTLRAKNAGYKLLVSTKAVVHSYVKESGLKTDKRLPFFKYLNQAMTSIKSPISIPNRWRWAKKHAKGSVIVYFVIDMLRVLNSVVKSWIKLPAS